MKIKWSRHITNDDGERSPFGFSLVYIFMEMKKPDASSRRIWFYYYNLLNL